MGNVRVSFKAGPFLDPVVVETSNYYPFGLKHNIPPGAAVPSSNPALKYKYNGKELTDALGLNTYDFGARNYDPALGRWMNIDPKE